MIVCWERTAYLHDYVFLRWIVIVCNHWHIAATIHHRRHLLSMYYSDCFFFVYFGSNCSSLCIHWSSIWHMLRYATISLFTKIHTIYACICSWHIYFTMISSIQFFFLFMFEYVYHQRAMATTESRNKTLLSLLLLFVAIAAIVNIVVVFISLSFSFERGLRRSCSSK